jgi:crotonobetainyl-CoA:carnitine CoA-transferase CaiB-like acyl-CoA transferase
VWAPRAPHHLSRSDVPRPGLGTSLGDTGNGLLSAMGVIQALYHRARTGVAQAVDTSILNAGLLLASMASIRQDGTPLPRPQLDAMQPSLGPLYRLYETADGWICLAAVMEDQWHRLARGDDQSGPRRRA